MYAAEVVGNGEVVFDTARWISHRLRDGSRPFVPAAPTHAVADDGGPRERILLARRETAPAYHHWLADSGEGRRRRELARSRQSAHPLLCLLLYWWGKYRLTRGQVEAQREPRPVALGALLHIAVGKSEFTVQYLEQVQAGSSAGGNGECRRPRRRDR